MSNHPYTVRPDGGIGWGVYYNGSWGIGHVFVSEAHAHEAAACLNGLVSLEYRGETETDPRRFLTVRYDVTGLSEDEIACLAMEAEVQGEASDGNGDPESPGHPSVRTEAILDGGWSHSTWAVVSGSPTGPVRWTGTARTALDALDQFAESMGFGSYTGLIDPRDNPLHEDEQIGWVGQDEDGRAWATFTNTTVWATQIG